MTEETSTDSGPQACSSVLPDDLARNNEKYALSVDFAAPKYFTFTFTKGQPFGLKVVDPSLFTLPKFTHGNRSILLIVDFERDSEGNPLHGKTDINAGDALIAVGGQREENGTVKWFDLRPLNFVEGYALLRSVRDEYDCVKLIIRTDVFPQGLGCSRVVQHKVTSRTVEKRNAEVLKEKERAKQRLLKAKEKPPAKKAKTSKAVDKSKAAWGTNAAYDKVYRVTKSSEVDSIGISLSVANPQNIPIWLPKPFKTPVLNFPFVSAVYDASPFKDKVRPGDVVMAINGKSMASVSLADVLAIFKANTGKDTVLKMGRLKALRKGASRFNRLVLGGKSGKCLPGAPLPTLDEEKHRERQNDSVNSPRTESALPFRTPARKALEQEFKRSKRPLPALSYKPYESQSIRVGDEYQAEVDDISSIKAVCGKDWDPSKLKNHAAVSSYVKCATTSHNVSLDTALKILHRLDYDVDVAYAALERLSTTRQDATSAFVGSDFTDSLPTKEWSPEDMHLFTLAMYRIHKRDFKDVHVYMKAIGSTKSVRDIVDFYYGHWKTTRAYDDWRLFVKSKLEDALEFHNDICSTCRKDGGDGNVLCCDTCNLVFHTTCLDPPMEKVPNGDWNCPVCVRVYSKYKNKEALMEVVQEYISTQNVSYG